MRKGVEFKEEQEREEEEGEMANRGKIQSDGIGDFFSNLEKLELEVWFGLNVLSIFSYVSIYLSIQKRNIHLAISIVYAVNCKQRL